MTTPNDVRAASARLDAAGAALARLPVEAIVDGIDAAVRRLQERKGPLRTELLRDGPAQTGYSAAALAYAVDVMLNACHTGGLRALLAAELGNAAVLDGFAPGVDGVLRQARGPGRQLHIYAGTVPTVPVIGIACALLLKSPVLVKPSRHDPLLPMLFARALAEAEPALGAAVAVLSWRGGEEDVEAAALEGVGALLVHGTDATVDLWRRRMPAGVLFAGHGHCLSAAVVGRETLTRSEVEETARRLACDVGLFDGRGCLSCRLALIERGGELSPEQFSAFVANALADLERTMPRGGVEPDESARIRALRDTTALRQAAGQPVLLYASEGGTHWTVLLDANATPAPAGRVAALLPIDDLREAPRLLAPLPLSTIGLALPEDRVAALAPSLAGFATRLCPLGRMGEPPLTWRQDGDPVLDRFVRWIALER